MESMSWLGMLFIRKEELYHNKKEVHAVGITLGAVWCLWPSIVSARAPQTPKTTEEWGLSSKRVREEVMMESLTPNWRWEPWQTTAVAARNDVVGGHPNHWLGKRDVGEAGEGAGSLVGGRTGGVYLALMALVIIASKTEGAKLEKIIPKEWKEEITLKAGALLPAGSHPVGPASPAPGFLWAQMADTWIMDTFYDLKIYRKIIVAFYTRTQLCGDFWSGRGWASLSVLNHQHINSHLC